MSAIICMHQYNNKYVESKYFEWTRNCYSYCMGWISVLCLRGTYKTPGNEVITQFADDMVLCFLFKLPCSTLTCTMTTRNKKRADPIWFNGVWCVVVGARSLSDVTSLSGGIDRNLKWRNDTWDWSTNQSHKKHPILWYNERSRQVNWY